MPVNPSHAGVKRLWRRPLLASHFDYKTHESAAWLRRRPELSNVKPGARRRRRLNQRAASAVAAAVASRPGSVRPADSSSPAPAPRAQPQAVPASPASSDNCTLCKVEAAARGRRRGSGEAFPSGPRRPLHLSQSRQPRSPRDAGRIAQPSAAAQREPELRPRTGVGPAELTRRAGCAFLREGTCRGIHSNFGKRPTRIPTEQQGDQSVDGATVS
ncbi:uncharacterized protein LOC117073662 isoform X2 [Trachypithecus francoisi]|uniref:uncharacterized protein LOC117073662 isoform X2 n=1 Tax=Trachypithecus francoisi TaxID=54180 RepID=UPI00141ADBA0|nr:uncharacterized protein LOC117073662 isoform X2 [Trachypithecus francoisi]